MALDNRSAGPSHLGDGVGLSDAQLIEMYRQVTLARALDERMWILNRAGRVSFVISGQGHEGAQVGITSALRPGHDWMAPFYRSVAAVLTFGMTPREIMLGQFARAMDPSSGAMQVSMARRRVAARGCSAMDAPRSWWMPARRR